MTPDLKNGIWTPLNIPSECLKWIQLHRTHLKNPYEYGADVEKDFKQIEKYLPEKVDSILDIGCGMAGIDVFLKRKYPEAKLTLLDSDGETWGAGWNNKMVPFTNRSCAESLLFANGVQVDEWKDVGTFELLEADLIISLLSWGFHYPLNTYNVEGLCIVDLRRGREEPRGDIIATTDKYNRCRFAKKGKRRPVRNDSDVS